MILARLKSVQRKPGIVTVALPVTVAAYAVMELMFDISSAVARFLGRDPTLTGRTDTWNALLQLQTNPLLGLGYSSLWIGERLEGILAMLNVSYLNEAHSGYLETYLTLGFVGLFLLAVFLLSSFRALSKHVLISHHFASFAISVWLVTILYNVTESAFGSSLVWNVLLLCVVISRAGGERALKAPSPLQRWTTGRSDLRSRPVAAHVPTTFSHTE
jgi:O-antigen ligase